MLAGGPARWGNATMLASISALSLALLPTLYGGSTTQGNPFVLELANGGRAVEQIVTYEDIDCESGLVVSLSGSLPLDGARVARTGALRARVTNVQHLDGQSAQVLHVLTGKVRWRARSAPGRIYAGATSQDQPIVVELDKRRRTVERVRFGWSGPCPGEWAIGDRVEDFPLHDGRFGDSFSPAFDADDGGRIAIDYDVAGRVTRTRASGRISVQFDRTDAAGALTQHCASGTVTWSLPST
jgi:hypothetical protein